MFFKGWETVVDVVSGAVGRLMRGRLGDEILAVLVPLGGAHAYPTR